MSQSDSIPNGMKSDRECRRAGRPRGFDVDHALERAMTVFWEKGYEGTSLDDLTREMGINRPSLYAAFGNKESLFRKVLDRYLDQFGARMQCALERPTARESVEALLMGVIEVGEPGTPRGCLLVQGALCGGDSVEPIRLELASRRKALEARLQARLEQAVEAGEWLPGGASDLARYFSTVLHGLAVQSAGGADRAELAPVVDLALRAWPRQGAGG